MNSPASTAWQRIASRHADLGGGFSIARALPTAARYVGEGAVVVNSFSKYWAMTGWRLGWLVQPDELVGPVDALAGNVALSPPALAQHAGVAAFSPEGYAAAAENVARYAASRGLVLSRLDDLGWSRVAPADGAFYVYADVGHLTDDTMTFTHDLLARTGVAIAPGVDFDTESGHRFVRFSFAGPGSDIEEGLARLSTVL